MSTLSREELKVLARNSKDRIKKLKQLNADIYLINREINWLKVLEQEIANK